MSEGPVLLLTGTTGYLGHEVLGEVARRKLEFHALRRDNGFDLEHPFEIERRLDSMLAGHGGREVVLVHMAAEGRWLACEEEPDRAYRINVEATGALSLPMARRRQRFVFVSTDLVFDGEHAPYDEEDKPRPSSVYGRSKLAGEDVAQAYRRNLVVRLPLLYGRSFDGQRGATDSLRILAERQEEYGIFTDEWRTPMAVSDAARRLVDLALDWSVTGIRHLFGPRRLSRWELALEIAKAEGLDPAGFRKASRLDLPGPERPRDTSLTTRFGRPAPGEKSASAPGPHSGTEASS